MQYYFPKIDSIKRSSKLEYERILRNTYNRRLKVGSAWLCCWCGCTQLLTSFSSQSGDWRAIRRLDWYIAPLLNADGYAYAHHKDGVSEPGEFRRRQLCDPWIDAGADGFDRLSDTLGDKTQW